MMLYICTEFRENIMELQLFFTAYCLQMLYICTKFHESILNGFKVIKETVSILINTKWYNSFENVRRDTGLVLCTSSDNALHLYRAW